MAITVESQCAHRAELGEAPHWDAATQTLLWVDIEAGTVHRLHPDTGQRHDLRLAPPLGFAIPTSDDEMAIAVQHDIEIVDAHTQRRRLAVVEDGIDDLRINDGKCDPRGRLVFGSLSHSRTAGAGALYSLERNGALTRLLTSVTLSNGLGWDTSGTRFYYVDSTTQRIDLLDYDLSTGTVSARRPFAHIDPADGLPDGLAIDAEGGVWVCLFAGGAVRRYDDNGHLSEVVRLPVSAPTSLAFGGKDLDTLFITTARHRLNATQRHEQPLAGAVLSCRPEIAGVAVPRFGVVAAV
jgi:sugar lactone lactonase YvrE